jgi:hypothetical protein
MAETQDFQPVYTGANIMGKSGFYADTPSTSTHIPYEVLLMSRTARKLSQA